MILLGLNHSPLHSIWIESEHATRIYSQNSEMHTFVSDARKNLQNLLEKFGFSE